MGKKGTVTESFIEDLMGLAEVEYSERIIHQVKRCVLDYIGVTYAGQHVNSIKMDDFVNCFSEDGECSLIGYGRKVNLTSAAVINGFNSHVIELDDGHRFGMLHLEATIITAMIAVAQKDHLNFSQFVKGVVVGYEATVRLACAIQPEHKQMGFHATGTCGAVGVACAIAAAQHFNKEQWKSVLSAAATGASGLLEVIDDGSQLKPFNIANAVNVGIIAANMGRAGFLGPKDILSGKRGFFKAFSQTPQIEALVGEGIFAIEKIYFKPYAACRHCHAPIECALNIVREQDILADNVTKIKVETYKLAVFGHDHTTVVNSSAAKMSIPYSVAAAIIFRNAGVEAFEDSKICLDNVQKLCGKVVVIENPELTAASPEKRGAIVTVTMDDCKEYVKKVEYPLGEPENRVDDTTLEEKCRSLLKYAGLNEDYIQKLIDNMWNINMRFEQFLNCI